MKTKNAQTPASLPYFLSGTILFSVFIGCLYLGPRLLNMDGDLGRHITLGKYIIETGSIPTIDIFSHTMTGMAFTPHEWMAEIIFALFFNWLGLTGPVLLTGLIIGLTWYLLSLESITLSRSFYFSLVIILIGIAASSIHWLSRPHIFTFLFLIIWVKTINIQMNTFLKALVLFFLMVFWVNFHGAFIAGIAYLVIDIIAKILRSIFHKIGPSLRISIIEKMTILLILSPAVLINPVGFKIIDTVSGFLQSQYLTSHTYEYLPPNFLNPAFWPYGVFLIISIVGILYQRKNILFEDFFQLIIWSIFGLISARNIPLAIIIGLPICSRWYGLRGSKDQIDKPVRSEEINHNIKAKRVIPMRILFLIGITSVIIGSVLIFPKFHDQNVFQKDVFPVQASEYVSSHDMSGNMFNEFTWGGYLLFSHWPKDKVFIDGQTDFYGEELTRDYASIHSASENYEYLLKKYNISWIIVKRDAEIVKVLAVDPQHWVLIYEDSLSVIYKRINN